MTGTFDESLLWPGPTHPPLEPYWQNLEVLRAHFSPRRPSGGCYFRNPPPARAVPLENEVPPGYHQTEQEDAEAVAHFSPRDHECFESEVYEVYPDDEALEPMIEAFGHACVQMPMLKRARLSAFIPVPLEINPGTYFQATFDWGICYLSPGTPHVVKKDLVDPECSRKFTDDG